MSEGDIFQQYEKISQRGRGALCRGRLQEATICFEEALRIEQEVHLRAVMLSHKQGRNSVCSDSSSSTSDLTDEPIFSSSPVSGTPPSTPSYSTKRFPEVLKRFRKAFTVAENKILTDRENEAGYLQQGAILCALNSWDAARDIYSKGIRRCRDANDKLKQALAELNRLENLLTVLDADKPDYDTPSYAGSLSTCSSGSERSGLDKVTSPRQSPGTPKLKQASSFFSRLRNRAFSPKLVPLNDTSEYRSSPRARSVDDLLEQKRTSPKLTTKRRNKSRSVSFDETDFACSVMSSASKRGKRGHSVSFDNL